MKSRPLGVESILATDHNTRRDDARGGSFLLAHQQLGALALPTNPTNGQTLTVTVNSTPIVITYVTSIGSTPNNILIKGTAALTAAATVNFLRRPDLTNANQIAATIPNQALLFYLGYSLPSGATTITPFSLNKNVNGASANLSSFTASATVTGASWTAQTMQLFVEDGTYYIGSTRVLFLGGSTPTFTAPVSNPRIDLVTADSTGTIAIVGGTESASPVAPSYPANKAVLAEIYHVVGETGLYDNENQQSGQGYVLNDVRPVMNGGGYISSPSQIASGIVIFDPGSDVQGNIFYYNGASWVLLAPGSAGQVLETGGPSANPSWASVFGTKLGQQNTQQTGSLPLSTPTTINSLSSLPAVGANNSLRIRIHFNGNTSNVNPKMIVAGIPITFTNSGGASDTFIEVTIVNRGSQTVNDLYWQQISGSTLTVGSIAGFNANLASAWNLSFTLDATSIASTYASDYLDAYLIG